MKLSWILVIILLACVAIFSVQNAGVITIHFLAWQLAMSAALVIQLAALSGALVGLMIGVWSRRRSSQAQPVDPSPPASSVEREPGSDA